MVRTKASWNGTNGAIVQPPAPGARCVALWNVYDETAASIARWCAPSSAATAPRNSWPNVLSSCMPSSRADCRPSRASQSIATMTEWPSRTTTPLPCTSAYPNGGLPARSCIVASSWHSGATRSSAGRGPGPPTAQCRRHLPSLVVTTTPWTWRGRSASGMVMRAGVLPRSEELRSQRAGVLLPLESSQQLRARSVRELAI